MTMLDAEREIADQIVRLTAELPSARHEHGLFSVEGFIATLVIRGEPPDEAGRRILERLCRSIEVARRLPAFYRPDLSRRMGGDVTRPPFAILLTLSYARWGAALPDWKWVNTALKMDGGILQAPVVVLPPEVKGALDAVLDGVLV